MLLRLLLFRMGSPTRKPKWPRVEEARDEAEAADEPKEAKLLTKKKE